MQGLEVTGIAVWSIYRDSDGPFRFYKSMQGSNPNSKVRTLCESIVRH